MSTLLNEMSTATKAAIVLGVLLAVVVLLKPGFLQETPENCSSNTKCCTHCALDVSKFLAFVIFLAILVGLSLYLLRNRQEIRQKLQSIRSKASPSSVV